MPFSLPEIRHPDRTIAKELQRRLDNLTKPAGSLGRLEALVTHYGVIRGTADLSLRKKAIFTFAADHGVSKAGVSAYPREVTAQMVYNFLSGGAAINVLCRHYGIENVVVDVGVDHEFGNLQGLVSRKVAGGTRNFVEEPAMTLEQAQEAIQAGMDMAHDYDLIGTGEMGIGNTTSSSAIVAAFSRVPPEEVVGRGTGIDDERLNHKAGLIRLAIQRRNPDPDDAMDVLTKMGGFEIAAITGLIVGAASRKIPVVVDGFISGAAALVAVKLRPACRSYLFMSHLSRERGHRKVMELLEAQPLLDLDLCLGEGTGAAIAMDLITAAIRLYNEMATFDSASVSRNSR